MCMFLILSMIVIFPLSRPSRVVLALHEITKSQCRGFYTEYGDFLHAYEPRKEPGGYILLPLGI